VEQVKRHIEAISDDHYNLNDIFNDPNFSLMFMSLNFLLADHLGWQDHATSE
jgi:hypothetical protein